MARLIIHCGLHKAGSTSIQHMLRANKAQFPAGVAFVSRGKRHFQALGEACRSYDLKNRPASERQIQKTLRKVLALMAPKPDDILLLSCEDFVGPMPSTRQSKPLYHLAAPVTLALEKAAKALGHQPEFVLYIRDRDTWLRSWHNHQILWRAAALGWDDIQTRRPVQGFDPVAIGEGLKLSLSVPVTVFRIEDDLKTPLGPGSSLLQLAGLNADQIATFHPVAPRQQTPRRWVYTLIGARLFAALPAGVRRRLKLWAVRLDRRIPRR